MDTNGRIMSAKEVQTLTETEKQATYLIPRKYRIQIACMNRVQRRQWLKRHHRQLIRADQVPDLPDACQDCLGTGRAGTPFFNYTPPVCDTCQGTGKDPKIYLKDAAANETETQIPMIPPTEAPRPEPAQEPYP